MATYTQIYYHVVFSTKHRERTLHSDNEELLKYIWGIFKNNKCHLYRINGIEDHLHMLFSLHPTVALSDLVKDIKLATSQWIKGGNQYTLFGGWQEGYGAFTVGHADRDSVIEYIKNQQEHHRKISFIEEYRSLLNELGITFEEKHLE
jgi:REP element-mobilizing transposase RayT